MVIKTTPSPLPLISTHLQNPSDEAKNDPFLGGRLSPESNLFDQILP
jgi:hypothetical protein